jgi:hypothetical protein
MANLKRGALNECSSCTCISNLPPWSLPLSCLNMMLQYCCVSPVLGLRKTHCQMPNTHSQRWLIRISCLVIHLAWKLHILLPGLPCHQVPDGKMFLIIDLSGYRDTCVCNSRMRKIDSRGNVFGRQDPEHSGISNKRITVV